jgi:hypothetical protein
MSLITMSRINRRNALGLLFLGLLCSGKTQLRAQQNMPSTPTPQPDVPVPTTTQPSTQPSTAEQKWLDNHSATLRVIIMVLIKNNAAAWKEIDKTLRDENNKYKPVRQRIDIMTSFIQKRVSRL